MAKFRNKALAGQTVGFAYVGQIELDAEGFFEVEHEKLVEELKHVKGFEFVPEEVKQKAEEKPVAVVEETKVEAPAPAPKKGSKKADKPAEEKK